MGNRIVIIFPTLILLFVLSYSLNLVLTLNHHLYWPINLRQLAQLKRTSHRNQEKTLYTSAAEIFQKINQFRQNQDLAEFTQDDLTCGVSDQINQENNLENDQVFQLCRPCSQAALVKVPSTASANQVLEYLLQDENAAGLLVSSEFTHLCARESDHMLTLFFAQHKSDQTSSSSSSSTTAVVPQIKQSQSPPKNFSEDELWQALTQYRRAHRLNDLGKDEKICQYARKRVQDQLTMFAEKEIAAYPVPEKYPLDAHRGFSADAESNYAFEVTQRTMLAENLAYWPTAQSATHIIEWGWDSSTEGHREAQLSIDYTNGCISGQDGFYVAIFGK